MASKEELKIEKKANKKTPYFDIRRFSLLKDYFFINLKTNFSISIQSISTKQATPIAFHAFTPINDVLKQKLNIDV